MSAFRAPRQSQQIRSLATKEASDLYLRGQLCLSKIENNGVRVDKKYLKKAIAQMETDIAEKTKALESTKFARRWRRVYEDKTNFGSRSQLAHVAFKVMGLKAEGVTSSGRDRTDKAALEKLNIPFVQDYIEIEELKKAKTTYLEGIQRAMTYDLNEECWLVHPNYNLNTVRSFRSSCNNPNFQNVPVRNPKLGEIIRRCYIPRKGRHFIEVDYAQIEVRIAACYNLDPKLIRYIKDKSTDMHRDMACRLFFLKSEDFIGSKHDKAIRHCSKNGFVFPQFYGSVYFQCAPNIWDMISRQKLTIENRGGIPLMKHLRKNGIRRLGNCDIEQIKDNGLEDDSFVAHVEKVQDSMWKTFRVYDKWRRNWYDSYLEYGEFRSKVGFHWSGEFGRNDVTNYPIQCDAFQCTLWSLDHLQNELERHKMKTLLIGEIHDSFQADGPQNELDDFLSMAKEIMTEKLVKEWDWIIVPLETEAEVSEIGKSWYEKRVWIPNQSGRWSEKL